MKYLFCLFFIFSVILLPAQDWQVTTISNDGFKPVLTVDENDVVHIVYMTEASPGWVNYAKIENGVLTTMNVSNGYFYGPPDITYDIDNKPVIAYHDHDQQDQAVRRLENGAWKVYDTHDPGHDGWDNAIIVDSENNFHTSSVDPSDSGGDGIEYGFFDGNSWAVESTGGQPIRYANATAIALDSENKVYISYFNNVSKGLELATNVSGSWEILEIDNQNAGRFSSLVIDENDDIYISYYEESGLIKLATRKNGNWSIQNIDMLENVEVSFSGARNLTAISKYNGIIGIAYGDKEIVKFARVTEDGVDIETVVEKTDQDFGQIVSLDFTSSGKAFIAYAGSMVIDNPFGNIFVAEKEIISSTSQISVEQLDVFPNPVMAGQKLFIGGQLKTWEYSLLNINGQLAASGTSRDGEIKIPIELETGSYILKLSANEGKELSFAKIQVSH